MTKKELKYIWCNIQSNLRFAHVRSNDIAADIEELNDDAPVSASTINNVRGFLNSVINSLRVGIDDLNNQESSMPLNITLIPRPIRQPNQDENMEVNDV